MNSPGPKRQERKMIFEVVWPSGAAYYRKLQQVLRATRDFPGLVVNVLPRSTVREMGVPVW